MRLRLLISLVLILVLLLLLLASCGDEEEAPTTTPSPTVTATPTIETTPTATPDTSAQYDSDAEMIEDAITMFYVDVHKGPDISKNAWCYSGGENDHVFPTSNGEHFNIMSDPSQTDGDYGAQLLYFDHDENEVFTPGEEVTDSDISNAAIWMGLLMNPAADGSSGGCTDRGAAAPLTGEESMYLAEFPEASSQEYNGNPATPGGTYTWIVGKNARIFGAYKAENGNWYSGFSGVYP